MNEKERERTIKYNARFRVRKRNVDRTRGRERKRKVGMRKVTNLGIKPWSVSLFYSFFI